MHAAVQSRSTLIINTLIGAGVPLDHAMTEKQALVRQEQSFVGITPVLRAAMYGCVDVLRALAQAGADLRSTDVAGRTAMHYCAVSNDPFTVRYLLYDLGESAPFDLLENRTIEQKYTPLLFAASIGAEQTIVALLSAGANVHAKDIRQLRASQVLLAELGPEQASLLPTAFVALCTAGDDSLHSTSGNKTNLCITRKSSCCAE
jgi:hypothetical protein